jgi:hypothetical protein
VVVGVFLEDLDEIFQSRSLEFHDPVPFAVGGRSYFDIYPTQITE